MDEDPANTIEVPMDNIDLVKERLRAYSKNQIDLHTVEGIVQDFNTRTTPPVPPFPKEDAQAKFSELHADIETLISGDSLENLKNYIKWTKTYTRKWTETHLEIMKELIESDKATVIDEVLLDKVLRGVLWLINFYISLTGNRKKYFFQLLAYFLQDLLITLLVLKCLRTMGTEDTYIHTPTDGLPAFKIIPHLVSPESDLFQSLILKEMIIILGWNMPQRESPEDLAAVIVEYFKPQQYGWPKKGVEGVLTVVKDQSRYMTLRSPHLQRNFVAYKTKHQVETISIPRILARIPDVGIDDDIKSVYDLLKVDDDHPLLRSREEHPGKPNERKKIISHIYHIILKEIILFLDIKNIKFKGGWIDTDNFLNVVGNVAREALSEKKASKIPETIEALAMVIGLRAYLSSIEGTVVIDKDALIHQEVLFRLIAFRALLMCTLHISPPGVQQVARELPRYAKDVRLYLQTPNKKNFDIYALPE